MGSARVRWLCATKGLRRKILVPSRLVLQWPDNVTFIWLHLVCGVQRGKDWHPSLVISYASRHLFLVLAGIYFLCFQAFWKNSLVV